MHDPGSPAGTPQIFVKGLKGAGAGVAGAAGKAGALLDGSSGGGYEFTPEEIDAVLTQWKELRDGLQQDLADAESISQVQAPSAEPASATFLKVATSAGNSLVEQTKSVLEHVEKYVEALEEAKAVTEAAEAQAAQDAVTSGGNL
ncbi:hypothetical protein BJF85_06150 [Saccharomonospora sp. CUA-673]|uniref:hypothetical protein n=1 Tax=Saccharomonospora sp. CUA-673 TaxID=1904969 RepID=UPI000964B632|nr:hypothetical protein [Saccharomonospora sp. CUA-673]OLT40698.1 hypothetical protein BJF85_06150 [Saccharomonospora sp. CUA-673]